MTSGVISESQQDNISVTNNLAKDAPDDAYTLLLPNTDFEEKVKRFIQTFFTDFDFIIPIFIGIVSVNKFYNINSYNLLSSFFHLSNEIN